MSAVRLFDILVNKTVNQKRIIEKNSVYIYINPFLYLKYRKGEYIDMLEKVDVILFDGVLFVSLFKLFRINNSLIKRYSFDMTSLAPLVFEHSILHHKKIALIGGREDDIVKSKTNIERYYPDVNISFIHNGYFDFENERTLIFDSIIANKIDIVIVGLGTPKQEQFLLDLKTKGWNGIGYTCGAFITQVSSGLFYYPRYINTLQLRWLYRLIKEPFVREKVLFIPKFVFCFVFDYLRFVFTKPKCL